MGNVAQEIDRARAKFPTNRLLFHALVEEVGELAQALLERGNTDASQREAMQVACVAIRIMAEGDGGVEASARMAIADAKQAASDQEVFAACMRKRPGAPRRKTKDEEKGGTAAAPGEKKPRKAAKAAKGKRVAAAVAVADKRKVCPHCGGSYVAKRKDQTNCLAEACKKAAAAAWNAKRAKEPKPARADATPETSIEPAGSPSRLERIKALAGGGEVANG